MLAQCRSDAPTAKTETETPMSQNQSTDDRQASKRYNVYRYSMSGRKRLIRRNLTLADARAHCQNPNTSSDTTTERTRGRWFDGFEEV
jgi:hypothetical protein